MSTSGSEFCNGHSLPLHATVDERVCTQSVFNDEQPNELNTAWALRPLHETVVVAMSNGNDACVHLAFR